MSDRQIPNSLREKYLDDRTRLYHLLWSIDDAIINLTSGNVSSYSLGNRSVSYQDITKLEELKADTEKRIEELEAKLSGRSIRNVTVNTFLDPSLLVPKW